MTSSYFSQIGSDIDGSSHSNFFGWSTSISADGSIIAIGAPHNAGNGDGSGHVRIYQNVNGTWTQVGSDIDGEAADDSLGWSVSLLPELLCSYEKKNINELQNSFNLSY